MELAEAVVAAQDVMRVPQAIWLPSTIAQGLRQSVLLGERQDMDDIVAAIGKIQRYSHELQE